MRSIQRLDDHTIEKVVVQEKEKIVYIEKEVEADDTSELDKEALQDDTRAQEGQSEVLENTLLDIEGEEEQIPRPSCEEGQCYWIDTCVTIPEWASCTDTDDEAWTCDEGYTEQNGTCYQICGDNECQSWTTCVERPNKAFCVNANSEVWRCEAGYVQSWGQCVLAPIPVPAPVTQPVVTQPAAVPPSVPEPQPAPQPAVEVDIGAFINPEPQQSLIQQRLQQTLSPVERLRLQNQE